MENSNRYPLNLRFFGDPAADTTSEANADDTVKADVKADTEKQPDKEQKTPPTLKDMLKNKGFQSELDQHVQKAITTAKSKWDEEQKLTEAELAKKRQAEADEKLSKREMELAVRELRADMVTEIGKRGLPPVLIEAVSLADMDTATASLNDVEKAYRAAVDAGIAEKLKGTPPPDGGGGEGGSFLKNFRAATGLKESTK